MRRLLLVFFLLILILPLGAQEKAIIAVLDFKTEGVSQNEMQTIISLLSSALFRTNKYIIIDVSERQTLLKELEFSASDCTDESCQLEIGKLLSAEAIVVGNLGKVGTRYVLTAKMLETETARTVNTTDGVYSSLDAMLDDIDSLAVMLAGDAAQPAAEAGEEKEGVKKVAAVKPERDSDRYIEGNYFSTGISAGLSIPIGEVGEVMKLGFTPLAHFNYNLDLSWGVLGFGVLSGALFESTTEDVRYQYGLYSFPAAITVKYATKSSVSIFAEASGGVIINRVVYKNEYLYREDLTATKIFLAPTVGAGININSRLGLSLFSSLIMIFFDDATYLGITPGLRAEFRL